MLLDSNIIIYGASPDYPQINDFIARREVFASAISYVEVLGFHRLTPEIEQTLRDLFVTIALIPIDQQILDGAVSLRCQRSMSLGDSIVAATALLRDLPIVTRNVKDFQWIEGLTTINPFDEQNV